VALLRCREAVEGARSGAKGDEKDRIDIILGVLDAPLKQIVNNCGLAGASLPTKSAKRGPTSAYDANAGQFVA